MVVLGRAQAPPPWEPPPPPAEIPPLHPPANPPPPPRSTPCPPPPPPPPRVLTDSWGVCRIKTGCSRPPVAWNSFNALPHCLGAVGSAARATHRRTAPGQWAVELLQCTASLPGGSGQCNLCNALPHCLGAGGQWNCCNARAHQMGGRGVLPRRRSLPMERLQGDGSPHWPGPTSLGDGESCPGGGRCLWSSCGGRKPPLARAHQMGGWGVLPRRRSVRMEGQRGTVVPNGPTSPVTR